MYGRVRVAAALLPIVVLLGAGSPAAHAAWKPGPPHYGIGSELNVPVRMSDGTVLRADVYTPTKPSTVTPATGRFPVILTQTPYGKDAALIPPSAGGGGQLAGAASVNRYLVRRGYITAVVDVRGTGSSQGRWGLFDPIQGSDGATLARWAAGLPHSTGKVGLLGASYLGINQFLTVEHLGRHSPVKAMFPIISGNEIYRDTVAQGGLIDFEFGGFYLGLTGALNTIQPLLETLVEQPGNSDVLLALAEHIGGLLAYHAATLLNISAGGVERYDGRYWRDRSPLLALRKVVRDRVPAFMVGGWFDLFQRGEPLDYSGLQNALRGRPVGAPMIPGQRPSGRYQLMMGPWYHLTAGQGINLNRLELAWFDRWLKGIPTGIDRTRNPLHLYQLRSGHWRDTSRYPLENARPHTYYLQPAGGLGLRRPFRNGGDDTLLYTGLNTICGRSLEQWGAGTLEFLLELANGTDTCATNDSPQSGPGVATYTTGALKRPRVIAGPIDATVYLSSNRPETELIATVDDVAPNGKSTPITSGALLGSFRKPDRRHSWLSRNDFRAGKPILPYHAYTRASRRPVPTGKVVRYDLEVFPTFAKLRRGHRLRVRIATSDVPHVLPLPGEALNLIGGVYHLQHNRSKASFIQVPTAAGGAYTRRCRICR
jgi:putative CocE/NonD family hydrolase